MQLEHISNIFREIRQMAEKLKSTRFYSLVGLGLAVAVAFAVNVEIDATFIRELTIFVTSTIEALN